LQKRETNKKREREKQFTRCMRSSIRLMANFSSETTEARNQGDNIFKKLKGKIINQEFCICTG
jgi:hypothetical protein